MPDIKRGDLVRFYDCQQANIDKDFSGSNPKHYPIGKVLSVYNYTSYFGYTDTLCDIKINERISKGHFINGLEIILSNESRSRI